MGAVDHGWRPLGEVLVDAGLLAERDLLEALAEQERSGQRLGEVLVARGFVSGAAVANALAEQRGSFFKTEHGFGTGLRALTDRSEGPEPATEPEAPPLSATPARPVGHLLFLPTPSGYLLLEQTGAAPTVGDILEVPQLPNAPLVVTKLAGSPLPRDQRVCAYLVTV